MPSLSRPDVDLLENLSAAIVVDQERMGANSRSTVGTATDAYDMLRVIFSRLGKPYIGPSTAFSFNVPAGTISGEITLERGRSQTEERQITITGGMCPECEGLGRVSSVDIDALVDRDKSLNEGAITFPNFGPGTWYHRIYLDSGFFDPDQKRRDFTAAEWERFLHGPEA
jgi:excinuclease UvrABC ATPase subunit